MRGMQEGRRTPAGYSSLFYLTFPGLPLRARALLRGFVSLHLRGASRSRQSLCERSIIAIVLARYTNLLRCPCRRGYARSGLRWRTSAALPDAGRLGLSDLPRYVMLSP